MNEQPMTNVDPLPLDERVRQFLTVDPGSFDEEFLRDAWNFSRHLAAGTAAEWDQYRATLGRKIAEVPADRPLPRPLAWGTLAVWLATSARAARSSKTS